MLLTNHPSPLLTIFFLVSNVPTPNSINEKLYRKRTVGSRGLRVCTVTFDYIL